MGFFEIAAIVLRVLFAAPGIISDVMAFIEKIKQLFAKQSVRLSVAQRQNLKAQAKDAINEAIRTKDASKLEANYQSMARYCADGMC